MSEFNRKTLQNLEKLSRIKCNPDEEGPLQEGISKILKYVEQLEEINTDDVLPCNFVLQDLQQNVFREDEVKDLLSTEEFLSNAPDQVAQMIKVPTIIHKQS